MRKKIAVGLAIYVTLSILHEQYKQYQRIVILAQALKRTQRVSEAMLADLRSAGAEFPRLQELLDSAKVDAEFEALIKDF